MKRVPTARQLEIAAAAAPPPRAREIPPPLGEAMAMLSRRGFRPQKTAPDLPFPNDLPEETAERLSEKLGHYAFRLFLRGAIQRPGGFAPEEATHYLTRTQSKEFAESLVDLGLAERVSRVRYRLIRPARSFGGMLEWYVARELHHRFGFDVATGVKLHAPGVGGDLDVIAAAEGKLLYLELKSSPPKHLSGSEVASFFDRLCALRPDVTLFVMDTALRLGDKVLPMLVTELERRQAGTRAVPRRLPRDVWALTPHLYVVNGRSDLIANIRCAIARGLLALGAGI